MANALPTLSPSPLPQPFAVNCFSPPAPAPAPAPAAYLSASKKLSCKSRIRAQSRHSPEATDIIIRQDVNTPRGGECGDIISETGASTWAPAASDSFNLPPLVDALRTAAKRDVASFHFPGHNRGLAAPPSLARVLGTSPFHHDLPELPELDNLFSPQGPILDAQRLAAELFGASDTWFLVGGTTCGIHAAIMATCSPGDTLILPRNSHLSAISAMVLSGAIPKYIIPEYSHEWDFAGGIDAGQVQSAFHELASEGRKAAAVLLTSPTYQGICSDIVEISSLCHSVGIPLIVDEAHGAHLGFHCQLPRSALQQGADIVVQSTHKVLFSLTQSSMLHVSGNLVDQERIHRSLQTLQTTSPSSLLLASLDAARAQLSGMRETNFDELIRQSEKAKMLIKEIGGVSVLDLSSFSKGCSMDPFRLTLGFWKLGLSGYEADDFLDGEHGIVCEVVGSRFMTFAISLGICVEHIHRLVSGIKHLREVMMREEIEHRSNDSVFVPFSDISMSMSPREAFFASKRTVALKDSIGKVSGEMICSYPPGIPVVWPGEVVSERALDYLLLAQRHGADITGAADPTLARITICVA
ncbi:hypothetical protein MLD38_006761 [Melastoma candidum]|uniref:Uncharacterized protein n=1 Tax=Melastoma candidum TaxID=119954 RepID=A0ACB9RRX5_9MYRT|nr:hypothetical protein MLD38_006761 [Melastoma candidum]